MNEPFPAYATFAASASPPGVLQIPLEDGQSTASTVAALDDGSTLVGLSGVDGYGFTTSWGLAKVTADGVVDASFASTSPTPGMLATPWQKITQIEVDSQGRILLGGGYSVTRLLADGTPDTSFIATCISPCVPPSTLPLHSAGQVRLSGRLSSMVLLADDSLAIVTFQDLVPELSLTKLTSSGDRDLAFHATGEVPGVYTLAISGQGRVVALTDGRILLVALGTAEAYRFTELGAPDPGFGAGTGHVHLDIVPAGEQLFAVATHGPNHLLLTISSGCCNRTVFARVSVEGVTDTSFATNGTFDTASFLSASAVAGFVAPDLRIVARGRLPSGENVLFRLSAAGQLDSSFAPGSSSAGTLVIRPREVDHYTHVVSDIAFAPDGAMILVGGSAPPPMWAHTSDVAEVYRMPDAIESIGGSADALRPAVRLGPPTTP